MPVALQGRGFKPKFLVNYNNWFFVVTNSDINNKQLTRLSQVPQWLGIDESRQH
jgi:hypothetical protein